MNSRIVKPSRIPPWYSSVSFACILLMACLTACHKSDDDAINPQDALIKTWVLDASGTLTKDGSDVSAAYTGLTLTFLKDHTYTALNQGKLFKSSGTWVWTGNGTEALLLDGDFAVTVTSLTPTDLHLGFLLNTAEGNGRINSVAGEYTVFLKAKN